MIVFRNVLPEFRDERGDITKLIDDGKTAIKSVMLITSKKNSIRANHYHKKDSHYIYMMYGRAEYTEKSLAKKGAKKECTILNPGDMVYSPPMVAHAVKFLEDSIFLALATQSRKDNLYREDTIKISLI